MKTIYCLLTASVLFLTSCVTLKESEGVPAAKTIDGTELRLNSKIKRTDHGKHEFDLAGTLEVRAAAGSVPTSVSMNYFSVRAAKAGFFALPFKRNSSGSWSYGALTTSNIGPRPRVSERRESGSIFLDFEIPAMGGGLSDNPANYDQVDVVIQLVDSQNQLHRLANEAVPVAH